MTRTPLLSFLILFACDGASGTGADSAVDCGDPDGGGGDTGDIPSVAGAWTSSFAVAYWDDNCTAPDFDEDTEDWIGAFTVTGVFGGYSAEFHDFPDDRFEAAMDRRGGFTMTGEHVHEAGLIYANFSGLVYTDASERSGIDGAAFLGLDVDADTVIDCYARASWSANKSGL